MVSLGRFAAFAVAAALASAQRVDLRLPEAKRITGTVHDENGKPIAGASAGHSGLPPLAEATGADGRFEFSTRSPAFVIRKAGYESVLIRVQDDTSIDVLLHLTKRTFPVCSGRGNVNGIEGWGGLFVFRVPNDVIAGPVGRDADYGVRVYTVGRGGVRHGAGPYWSYGEPIDEYVWKSVVYDEEDFLVGRGFILDARGTWADGTRWRTLARFGESASYATADPETARLLDQLMDSVCLKRN